MTKINPANNKTPKKSMNLPRSPLIRCSFHRQALSARCRSTASAPSSCSRAAALRAARKRSSRAMQTSWRMEKVGGIHAFSWMDLDEFGWIYVSPVTWTFFACYEKGRTILYDWNSFSWSHEATVGRFSMFKGSSDYTNDISFWTSVGSVYGLWLPWTAYVWSWKLQKNPVDQSMSHHSGFAHCKNQQQILAACVRFPLPVLARRFFQRYLVGEVC